MLFRKFSEYTKVERGGANEPVSPLSVPHVAHQPFSFTFCAVAFQSGCLAHQRHSQTLYVSET